MNSTRRIAQADTLWRAVRADVLRRLEDAYPDLHFDEKVLVAEHAAREVQDLAKSIAAGAGL
ncbi:MAG: hypothetical protein ABWX92_00640 [Mycetocola sp.]